MNADEMPQMSAGTYTSATYGLGASGGGGLGGSSGALGNAAGFVNVVEVQGAGNLNHQAMQQWETCLQGHAMQQGPTITRTMAGMQQHPALKQENVPMANPDRDRLVRVFIVDTNKSLPQERRVIHKSDEFMTDLTDQELFYEVDIRKLLETHNAYRTTLVDKATKHATKQQHLEPARVRDLHMSVVTGQTQTPDPRPARVRAETGAREDRRV